jgi:hypothetical protein
MPAVLFRDPAGMVFLDGGAGNDALALRRFAPTSAAYVFEGGTGQNRLAADLSAANSDVVTLTASYVQSQRLGSPIYYLATGGNLGDGLVVGLGNGGNQVLVLGTQAGAPTTVLTGAGDDSIVVGTDPTGAAGQLFTLAAPLTIDGGAGNNFLLVSDAGRGAGDAFTVTGQMITAAAEGAVVNYRSTGGTFGKGVLLLGTAGDDNFTVMGQMPGASTVLFGQGGNDLFQVIVDTTTNYFGFVLDGGPGQDSLVVNDVTHTAVEHNHLFGGGAGQDELHYLGGSASFINYQNMEVPQTTVDPADSYIQALYQEHVGAAATPDAVALWRSVLATKGRAAVVQGIINLEQAREHQVSQWYVNYLGVPAPTGLAGWAAQILNLGQEAALANFLAANWSGLSDADYVRMVYRALLRRGLTDTELQAAEGLMVKFQRTGLVSILQMGAEYRTLTMADRFATLLHRAASQNELTVWVTSGLTQGQITVQFESTDEFYLFGG